MSRAQALSHLRNAGLPVKTWNVADPNDMLAASMFFVCSVNPIDLGDKAMKKLLIAAFAALIMAFSGLAAAVVDLNSATKEELEAVKGIGPKKAQAIIDHRGKNGPFKSVDDLKGIKGFGQKTIDKLRPELTVGGASAPAAAPAPTPVVPAPAKK